MDLENASRSGDPRIDRLSTYARKLAFELRARVATNERWYPLVFIPRVLERRRSQFLIDRHTTLVVDGFQSSGNSSFAAWFGEAQPAPARVCHHLHSPGEVIVAVRRGIPTVILFRQPNDAVLATIGRWQHVSARQAMTRWIRYYTLVLPLLDQTLVVPFEEVVTNPDGVIGRINDRFGLSFATLGRSPQESYDPDLPIRRQHRERSAGRRAELESPTMAGLRAQANGVYAALLTAASS